MRLAQYDDVVQIQRDRRPGHWRSLPAEDGVARRPPEATRRFAEAHGLQGTLRYLIGSRPQLAKVWADYAVAQVESASSVGHTDAVYLIDRKGRTRVLLHSDVAPDALASELRALANER